MLRGAQVRNVTPVFAVRWSMARYAGGEILVGIAQRYHPTECLGGLGFTNKVSPSNSRENVRNLQLARERTWQPRGSSRVLSVNQRLLERLEAVNAVLRSSVMELVLQIQALRDAFGHPQSEIQPNRYYRPSA